LRLRSATMRLDSARERRGMGEWLSPRGSWPRDHWFEFSSRYGDNARRGAALIRLAGVVRVHVSPLQGGAAVACRSLKPREPRSNRGPGTKGRSAHRLSAALALWEGGCLTSSIRKVRFLHAVRSTQHAMADWSPPGSRRAGALGSPIQRPCRARLSGDPPRASPKRLQDWLQKGSSGAS
jgi:hypothetical protein